jgi:hypothetical protein
VSGNESGSEVASDTKIFDSCRRILQKVNVKYGGLLSGDGHLFTYSIDGLIFQPVKLGVGQNFEGDVVDKIGGRRWASNLKWKPEIHTTIDFKVKFNKEIGTNKPVIIYHDERRYIDATLFMKLYIRDKEMKCYMALKLLNEGEITDYYPEDYPFNPVYPTLIERADDGTPINMASTIRLPIDKNGAVKTEHGDLIEDGMIVECRFDVAAPIGFQWIPSSVRNDKKDPNAANTALTTWNLINNPISTKMITTTGESADTTVGFIYYKGAKMNRSQFESTPMNNFNNFVKSSILFRGLKDKQKARVLDLGCGKLADFKKFARLKVDTYIGVDVAPDNFINRDDGAAVRALQINLPGNREPDNAVQQLAKRAFLILGTLNKNLLDGSAALDPMNQYYLDVLYGRYKPMGRGKLETIYGLGLSQFHLALSSFNIHYFLNSQEDFHQFLLNVQENLKDQGHFIVFCLDGKEILKSMGDRRSIQGGNVWSITVPEDIDTPMSFEKTPYGHKIVAYTDRFFKPTEEYLVDIDFVEQECLNYDLKLVDSKLFNDDIDDLYDNYGDEDYDDNY